MTRIPLRFSVTELAGSLGDLGLFLPLAVALSRACTLDLAWILVAAGLANLLGGFWLRQPIPVQPMKALAVLAITGSLGPGELAASGLLLAVLLALVALTGLATRLGTWVPSPLIHGLQLGLGLKLVLQACGQGWRLPWVGSDSFLIAILVLLLLGAGKRAGRPALLYAFALGFLPFLWAPSPGPGWRFPSFPPFPAFAFPAPGDWYPALLSGVLPQFPLTLLNSVLAVSVLSAGYFPGQGIPPRRFALGVSALNFLFVPLGGMPMCYGSGGLAAQHAFGARSGGSLILLGTLLVLAGGLGGGMLPACLALFPVAVLWPLLFHAGLELAGTARRSPAGFPRAVVLTTGLLLATTDLWVGLAGGLALHLLLSSRAAEGLRNLPRRIRKRGRPQIGRELPERTFIAVAAREEA